MMQKYYIVVPNWNGADKIGKCLDSLLAQSMHAEVIVVDNNSTDDSVELIEERYSQVILMKNRQNLGFAGGVNTGISHAMKLKAKYIALFNNDAVADKRWLESMVRYLDSHPKVGIATGQLIASGGSEFDSTGECYSIWGLPFPRGRGEAVNSGYQEGLVFGASGGASLYRVKMLDEIGLFDEDFFAYYEDVDISFRAQLGGWKVAFEPLAKAFHEIGATSSQIKGFTTYHTLKNLPLLLWKNVPWALMLKIWPRLVVAYIAFVGSALKRRQFGPVFKGLAVGIFLWPKKLIQRHKIQKHRQVSAEYINSIIVHDLPPGAVKLRGLRLKWWRLTGKV